MQNIDIIENPKKLVLVRLKKDEKHKGNSYFAVFDAEGTYIRLQFKNDREINFQHSFNEKKLKQMGFKIKENEVDQYLINKGLKRYDRCGCLIGKDVYIEESECEPQYCITPPKIKKIIKSYT